MAADKHRRTDAVAVDKPRATVVGAANSRQLAVAAQVAHTANILEAAADVSSRCSARAVEATISPGSRSMAADTREKLSLTEISSAWPERTGLLVTNSRPNAATASSRVPITA